MSEVVGSGGGLSDGDLDRIELLVRSPRECCTHLRACTYHEGWDDAEDVMRVDLLVGEVRRLRAGIRNHREAAYAELACCDDCTRHGKEVGASYERRLWALLADQEADR